MLENVAKIHCKLVCGIFLVLIMSFVGNQAFAQTESGDSSLVVAKGISQDGTVVVTVSSTPVEIHKPLALKISFTDSKGNKIVHENYAITGMQQEGNGITILSNHNAYAANGDDLQVTLALDNPSPVNFLIQLQGSGLSGTDPSTWTGPIDTVGITIGMTTVPEFGPLVPMILASSLAVVIFFIRRSGIRSSYFDKYAS
ncbi:MAG: hypothetical protein ACYC6W_10340 [Nitrosotalea sp.]